MHLLNVKRTIWLRSYIGNCLWVPWITQVTGRVGRVEMDSRRVWLLYGSALVLYFPAVCQIHISWVSSQCLEQDWWPEPSGTEETVAVQQWQELVRDSYGTISRASIVRPGWAVFLTLSGSNKTRRCVRERQKSSRIKQEHHLLVRAFPWRWHTHTHAPSESSPHDQALCFRAVHHPDSH